MKPFPQRRYGLARNEGGEPGRGTPPRSLVLALVLACASLMVLDQSGSVLDPARRAVGEVVGPAQSFTAGAVRPFVELPGWFEDKDQMRGELASLEAENDQLRSQVRTTDLDRNRLAEFEGLTAAATDLGTALVPARVIGIGASQSFSATVTIDAGSSSGITPDLTVLNNDGLVGRVLRVTSTTATVLLVVDPDSAVGARVAADMELGFLTGRGELGDDARLDLELVDQTVVPRERDVVVTWGSRNGDSPYLAGVPVGEVVSVYNSVRETSQRAVIDPFVDFAALDLVGVAVPSGTRSDRAVVEADGSLR
ncbi:rod shape-determining protein MreC [Nocardioides dongxiaopingii]|uniref:rod shape-determining protein MreC n=1 Tax=Nocardioides TaxID=1839 RepID=UPI0010C7618B|nr:MULTISPECIES: rod shape-determining protein MreC [Nocardioides]QCW49984.1 rod shape-determining protein MreC [Nocardioides sp. S-1144]